MEQVTHYEHGRICIYKGCKTILSIYNKHNTCFQHTHAEIILSEVRKPCPEKTKKKLRKIAKVWWKEKKANDLKLLLQANQ